MAHLMTGPEHYREAAALLESAADTNYDLDPADRAVAAASLAAQAQAHATLALTAAVLARYTDNRADWHAVLTATEGTG